MRIALAAALVLAFVSTPPAQTKPDFSGFWTNKRTDTRGGNLSGVVGIKNMTIAQNASSLRIERPYGENTVTIVLPLDGSKAEYTLEPGGVGVAATPRTLESRVQWKENKLVISTEYRKIGGETFA